MGGFVSFRLVWVGEVGRPRIEMKEGKVFEHGKDAMVLEES
jgi:hypothetical protein